MEFDFCTQFLHAFKWLENGRFLHIKFAVMFKVIVK